jgi:YcaO-like protein with predicted kinase domain
MLALERTVRAEIHTVAGRSVGEAEMRDRLARIAGRCGVTRVANITGLDRLGVPVCTAIRPGARSLAVSSGKGLSLTAAVVSALGESIEVWHAERPEQRKMYLSTRALGYRGLRHIDPMELPRCPCSEYTAIRKIYWVQATDIINDETVWVPLEAVHCDWRIPRRRGEHSVVNGTNGLGLGATYVEAVLHGLYEVIERDAMSAFDALSIDKQADQRLDTSSITDKAASKLLHTLVNRGVQVLVWDLSMFAGIAAYYCRIVEPAPPWFHPLPFTSGSGADVRSISALIKAMVEGVQVRASIISGSRDDMLPDRYVQHYDLTSRDDDMDNLSTKVPLSFGNGDEFRDDCLRQELDHVLAVLRSRGIRRVLVVDLSKRAFSLPVVKVIVPAMKWRPWEH